MNDTTAHSFRRSAAFTLIELVVVVAIIAIFLTVVGLSLRGGDRTVAVHSAQRTMSGLLSGARGQARMEQREIRVIVALDASEPESFLREVHIARRRALLDANGKVVKVGDKTVWNWIPTGSPTQLSRGAFIVPPEEAVNDPSQMFGDYEDPDDKRKSNGTVETLWVDGEQKEVLYFEFDVRGFVRQTGYRVVIAPAQRGQNTLRFDRSEQAVGFLVRPFGSVTLVSDPRGFDT